MSDETKKIYHIQAFYDDEANVWCATSEDIPGLILECETLDELYREIQEWAPEMIEHNEKIESSLYNIKTEILQIVGA